MNKCKLIACMVLICFVTTSCATVLTGTKNTIKVNTDPEGASVYFNDQKMGTTPLKVKFPRKNNITVKLTKEGYKDKIFLIKQNFNVLSVFSYLLLYFPILVDYATGAIWWLNPRDVTKSLEPIDKEGSQ
jgi:hypothetical protein